MVPVMDLVVSVQREIVVVSTVERKDINHVIVPNLSKSAHVVVTIAVRKDIVKRSVHKVQEVVEVVVLDTKALQLVSNVDKLDTCLGIAIQKVVLILLDSNLATDVVKLDILQSIVQTQKRGPLRSVTNAVPMSISWQIVPNLIQITLTICHSQNVTYVRRKDTWLVIVLKTKMAYILKVIVDVTDVVQWIILYAIVLLELSLLLIHRMPLVLPVMGTVILTQIDNKRVTMR